VIEDNARWLISITHTHSFKKEWAMAASGVSNQILNLDLLKKSTQSEDI
jgi:cell division inhibitor SulA